VFNVVNTLSPMEAYLRNYGYFGGFHICLLFFVDIHSPVKWTFRSLLWFFTKAQPQHLLRNSWAVISCPTENA